MREGAGGGQSSMLAPGAVGGRFGCDSAGLGGLD
eukprot:CAMPEP_0201929272 /NCGR_PEP_ID=MMETSP0903-20130614/22648_1 /ASSEMBLY_ACC=CAM_ASM_000552 /TAXON_ID=420261 /ORGANISM="Thalassiosira antarctica, Strain CCMP982" /LENGTH=33 /DNA_ID= /DNA_START= /DNA_END= /DNA_ORIENTATION=